MINKRRTKALERSAIKIWQKIFERYSIGRRPFKRSSIEQEYLLKVLCRRKTFLRSSIDSPRVFCGKNPRRVLYAKEGSRRVFYGKQTLDGSSMERRLSKGLLEKLDPRNDGSSLGRRLSTVLIERGPLTDLLWAEELRSSMEEDF